MRAVLFDLGNTLAEYYESCAYPELLAVCIDEVRRALAETGVPPLPEEEVEEAVLAENWEEPDHRVRPLADRLRRIFRLPPAGPREGAVTALCRAFMKPIFALGTCYPDSLPVLERLRANGVKVAIVSNAPWGGPAALCHEEAARLGLARAVDAVVFCTDAGWRKPSPRIFRFALEKLGGLAPGDCLFVGDHPQWDVEGPRAYGMAALLLDRNGIRRMPGERPLRHLGELWERL